MKTKKSRQEPLHTDIEIIEFIAVYLESIQEVEKSGKNTLPGETLTVVAADFDEEEGVDESVVVTRRGATAIEAFRLAINEAMARMPKRK